MVTFSTMSINVAIRKCMIHIQSGFQPLLSMLINGKYLARLEILCLLQRFNINYRIAVVWRVDKCRLHINHGKWDVLKEIEMYSFHNCCIYTVYMEYMSRPFTNNTLNSPSWDHCSGTHDNKKDPGYKLCHNKTNISKVDENAPFCRKFVFNFKKKKNLKLHFVEKFNGCSPYKAMTDGFRMAFVKKNGDQHDKYYVLTDMPYLFLTLNRFFMIDNRYNVRLRLFHINVYLVMFYISFYTKRSTFLTFICPVKNNCKLKFQTLLCSSFLVFAPTFQFLSYFFPPKGEILIQKITQFIKWKPPFIQSGIFDLIK